MLVELSNGAASLDNGVSVSQSVQHGVTTLPHSATPKETPQSTENRCSITTLYVKAHGSTIHRSQKTETPKCSATDGHISQM